MSNVRPQFALIVGTNASWKATAGTPTYVEVNGDASDLGSTATKFELVPSTRGPDYFHIKCCLNNKYLRIERGTTWLIVAAEDEPIDDDSATTVFWNSGGSWNRPGVLRKPLGAQTPWFLHIQNNTHRLLALTANNILEFQFIPWETRVILPRDVIFKGDNGRYLRKLSSQTHFEFAATDPADPLAAHTIHKRFDGAITISNNNSGEYFQISGNNIVGTTQTSIRTHFDPVRLDGNLFALRVTNSERFLHRDGNGSQLVANASTTRMIKEVRIFVEEQVLSREIFNIVYRIPDAIIQSQENIMVATGQVFNASDAPNHVDMRLAYSLQTTSFWNARVAGEFGVRSKVTAGIPFLKKLFRLEAEYEISANISGEYEWGETVEETTEIETSYSVEVPPKSTMTISITAFKATSDIPFSYTQRDMTLDGRIVTARMDDGLYTGANCYDFQYQAVPSVIETRSLPASSPLTMKSSNARRPKGPSTSSTKV